MSWSSLGNQVDSKYQFHLDVKWTKGTFLVRQDFTGLETCIGLEATVDFSRCGSPFALADFAELIGSLLAPHSMKAGEEYLNLGDNLSFIGEVQVVVGIRDYDDSCTWHSMLEVIGPCGAAYFIVCDQSRLPS